MQRREGRGGKGRWDREIERKIGAVVKGREKEVGREMEKSGGECGGDNG